MPSSKDIQKQIEREIQAWGEMVSKELGISLNKAINKRGSKVQEAALHFNERITAHNGSVTCQIFAASRSGKDASYWQVIENGRRKGARRPPPNAIGTDWMVNNNIDPRPIIQKLSKSKKLPDYAKAAKSFSYIVGRSISAKGIPAKPFIGSVLNEKTYENLRQRLTPLLGQNFKLIITGL